MNITTKFDIGDVAYFADDARNGKMIKVIIEIIETTSINPNNTAILYQVGSNAKFAKSQAYESDLLTYAEAVIIAGADLGDQINQLQGEINNL